MKTRLLKPDCILIVIIFISCFSNSYSQEFLKGYYINQTGDTIKGLIKYYDTEVIPDNLVFKKDSVSEELKFLPIDVKGYTVANRNFECENLTIDDSEFVLDKYTETQVADIEKGLFFVERLTNGNPYLYFYSGKKRVKHFFIKADTSFKELIVKQYYEPNKDIRKDGIGSIEQYKGVLKYCFRDCPKMGIYIQNVPLVKNSLIDLFMRYYKCSGQIVSDNIENKKDKFVTKFGIIGGVSVNALKCKGSDHEYLTEQNFSNSITPFAGLSLILQFPRNHERWSIENNITYNYFKFTGSYQYYYGVYSWYNEDFTFNISSLKINNLLKCRIFSLGTVGVSILAGLTHSLIINDKGNKMVKTVTSGSNVSVDTYNTVFSLKKYTVCYTGGLDIAYLYFNAGYRYSSSNNISDVFAVSTKIQTSYLYFGLNF